MNLKSAYQRALACDPVSAFGGIIAANRLLDGAVAEEIAKIFSEVIIAPGFTAEALAVLGAKKNLRLVETGGMPSAATAGLSTKHANNKAKTRAARDIAKPFIIANSPRKISKLKIPG